MNTEKIAYKKHYLTILTAFIISVGAGTINLYYKGSHDIIFYIGLVITALLSFELLRTIVILEKNT